MEPLNNQIPQNQPPLGFHPDQEPDRVPLVDTRLTTLRRPGEQNTVIRNSTLIFQDLNQLTLPPEIKKIVLFLQDACVKLRQLDSSITQFLTNTIANIVYWLLHQGEWSYSDYQNVSHYIFENYPKKVQTLPSSEFFSLKKFGKTVARVIEFYTTVWADWLRQSLWSRSTPIDECFGIYEKLPYALARSTGIFTSNEHQPTFALTEHVLRKWRNDEEFCQQFLSGVNPLHIRVVRSENEIPTNLCETLKTLNDPLKETKYRSVKDLIKDKKLYILDYADLRPFIVREDINPKRYFTAPTVLLCEDEGMPLHIVGIILNDGKDVVYHQYMSHKNKYLLAKMHVVVADQHIHEFQYHLGFAHLLMEPFIVATHRCFSEDHIIRKLLIPHFEETIFINSLARAIPDFTDFLAAGTVQGLKLITKFYGNWNFKQWNFENQLRNRGFNLEKDNGISNYFYRDDGALVWKAIGEYVKDVVYELYKNSDDELRTDGQLQKWLSELTSENHANVGTFPQVITRDELVSVLQTIIWNGSGLHSAINYPQFTYDGFLPNRPNAIHIEMPQGDHDISDERLREALPPHKDSVKFLLTFWLLSLPSEHHLMNLVAFDGTVDNEYVKLSKEFRRKMEDITGTINQRNQERVIRGKAAYKFLLPENIACSVNI